MIADWLDFCFFAMRASTLLYRSDLSDVRKEHSDTSDTLQVLFACFFEKKTSSLF